MKKTKAAYKRPTKKELDLHVRKAMRATRTRMRINAARLIADALRAAWADADDAAGSTTMTPGHQPGNAR